MKIVSQNDFIIFVLCKNLNDITKGHLGVVFNNIKYIAFNYAITYKLLMLIGFLYIIFIST